MSPDRAPAAPAQPGGQTVYNNVAQGETQVAVQVGVMHGDVHNLYQIAGDTLAEKFRVGCNYLKGNAQQRAEQLIGEAFVHGHESAEVAYFWALAVLSGRSFDHLDQKDFGHLGMAFRYADAASPEQWRRALAVVSRLMHCLAEQDSKGEADPDQFAEVMADFDRLPASRREEISRHLEMILDGGMQDHLDARYARELGVQRLDGQRKYRAWKFFEPDPVPPLRRQPPPAKVSPAAWTAVVVGGVLVATAFALLLPVLVRSGRPAVVMLPVVGGIGVLVALRQRWEQLARQRRLEARLAARQPLPDESWISGPDERSFSAEVKKLVNAEFRYYRPRLDQPAAKRWDAESAPVKHALCREIIDVYEDGGELDPAKWLVRWHTREFVRQWYNGAPADQKPSADAPPLASAAIALGVLAALAGLGGAYVIAFPVSWTVTLWAVPALLVGCIPLAVGGTAVYLEYRRHADDVAEAAERFDEQTAAYDRMRVVLADRPSDSEMAQWLDRDKAHVRMLAMRHYRLSNREVFAHTVLCEPGGWNPRRSRVVHGPPRYSTYRVLVFLLTGSGVRQFSVLVDFATGTVSNENRFTFRYDAIASAGVTQRSVRIDNLRPSARTSALDAGDAADLRRNADLNRGELVFARSFRLALVNNDLFNVHVENFDEGLVDRVREDPRTLLDLALDSAGITAALHILEAVAAEGKDWIARELRRRSRRFDTYQENLGPRTPPHRDSTANGRRSSYLGRTVPAQTTGSSLPAPAG
ncbi:hypothetical protein Daura_39920 [Dactylosporangium aurantiacum]|uniref:Uncharacterized protein n=1 Tax=Dactylosporangium aurantiacum TaxID=35754 RepID=A0A9Q9IHL3_9ACTN|nr:hypothetical protein [Dactylosporangium aurantiacum]MDG6101406.1 hypothetical protein [Dactylosporangium aurantiacum]UWZ52740.1 hypothetical protein Daura_39920 [Dactylosporangium aurantiacum]